MGYEKGKKDVCMSYLECIWGRTSLRAVSGSFDDLITFNWCRCRY